MKRYDYDSPTRHLKESDNGIWVRWEDVEKARRQLKDKLHRHFVDEHVMQDDEHVNSIIDEVLE